MYKVFFNDRALYLTDDFSSYFEERSGLFYKFRNEKDLDELIEFYGKLQSINSLYLFHYDLSELQEIFKSKFKYLEAAGGLVTNREGKILVINRLGKWDLPKGKLEKGESFQQAAVREVSEECGITGLEIMNPLLSTHHIYELNGTRILKKTYWFEMKYDGAEELVPQAEENIEQVLWMSSDKLDAFTRNTYASILDVLKSKDLISLDVSS